LYRSSSTLWLDAEATASGDARDALSVLDRAGAHGLAPDDYQAAALRREAAGLAESEPSDAALAAFDASLSLHLLRFWRDVHIGRVSPRALGFRLNAPPDDHDFPAMLSGALAAHRVRAVSDELTPPLVLYGGLMEALAHYRMLVEPPGALPVPTLRASIKPGASTRGLDTLRAKLVALGDLPADTPSVADGVYGGAIVDGVRRFQGRHGLDADGALGKATLAALAVPVSRRVQQLELALERSRWLPHLDEHGFLAVNIPMFHLWGWDARPVRGTPVFEMDVIVGRALDTQTPVFVEELRYLIFRPYWNVPPSILRNEILPALTRDPAYLDRQNMEIVAGGGDDASAVVATDENLARLRQGGLRVRQRPGPNNSLGLVKFVFPNDDNIYMHGTPAPQLFGRARRDFSHGCVRVADPVMLAEWLLRDRPEWTRERVLAAMQGSASERVTLTRPVQVILFYLTAVVMPEDGSVRFAEDIYGHDEKLARALAGH
jgi:murein L,D-transpeptidase YcbB/YkuD